MSWRVRYRSPSGTEKSETFYDEAAAHEWARLLAVLGAPRALAWLDQQQDAEARGQVALTVDGLFERWIDWKAKRRSEVRSQRTIMDYRRMYARHIRPTFGERPANLVSPGDVQAWIDGLDLAPKTVADYHSLLHSMFKWAVAPSRALVIEDPCNDTQLPKRRKKPPKGLRPDEWLILLQAAYEVDPDAADLLLFLASTGWRWSEAVAVQSLAVDHWADEDGRPRTYVTMGRILRREGNSFVFIDDESKSDAGLRRVRLKGAAEEMVLRRIAGRKPNDLILTTKRGGQWRYEHFYRRVWRRPAVGDDAPNQPRILERAAELGLNRPDLAPHWLRHTHVGMLILAGESLTAIQRRLGHASIKTTSDVYGRMIEDASDEGLDRVALMLGGRPHLGR